MKVQLLVKLLSLSPASRSRFSILAGNARIEHNRGVYVVAVEGLDAVDENLESRRYAFRQHTVRGLKVHSCQKREIREIFNYF